ncbi:MAG: 4-vinyl reductase [Archaeoglobaceae archaeon]
MDSFDVLTEQDISQWDRESIVDVFFSYEYGKMVFIDKAHVASLYNTFLVGIYLELTNIVGKAAKGLILSAAKNGGLRAGRGIKRRYERNKGEMSQDKAILVARNMLRVWSKGFGWGEFEVNMSDNTFQVLIKDSIEADGYMRLKKEESEIGMCWMIFGYIWGILEGLLDAKLSGEDKMCTAKGDDHCYIEFNLIG